jgi:DHA1 family bicyclomycin/chloramphenicol resistance-like MFS transporter
MRIIKENHSGISTILAFALIPLSGFATDVYIPSLPAMASHLNVPSTAVQLTLIIFMISSGLSQLFVGSLLDSFGRFKLNIAALIIFAAASFIIATSANIYVIYLMRVIHGITVATIVVSKRAYFVDIYNGNKLKHYVSLFSIIWASAPIIAPFIGGFLQSAFGWESNFYFLGIFTLIILVFELLYGGESLKTYHKFEIRSITKVYRSMIQTSDFTLGLLMLGLSYSMLMVYGMTSPFIIEHVFNYSAIVTGNMALVSGVSLMLGGIISKLLISKPLIPKITTAIILQLIFSALMITLSNYLGSIYGMMLFVIIIHLLSGFVFNNIFSYCLGRFSTNAGIASGVTGGAMYIFTSIFSSSIIKFIPIKSQQMLGVGYLMLALLIGIVFFYFVRSKRTRIAL